MAEQLDRRPTEQEIQSSRERIILTQTILGKELAMDFGVDGSSFREEDLDGLDTKGILRVVNLVLSSIRLAGIIEGMDYVTRGESLKEIDFVTETKQSIQE